jgi:hypothetical protein
LVKANGEAARPRRFALVLPLVSLAKTSNAVSLRRREGRDGGNVA